jgi:uncharacterized membrane protein
MTRIRNFLVLLRGRLWLIPMVIALAGALLAYLTLTTGASLIPAPTSRLWWLYSGDADTARNLLSTLLSGLMTMTSLVVSVTFVILTLAANQLGPRLISIFMADRYIQAVLGLFLGTIIYVLIVLRTLGDDLGAKGVPHIAVTVGSALTLGCLFALLFYVHKIARSIIADTMVDRVADDLTSSISATMAGDQEEPREAPLIETNVVQRLSLERSGYIQTIDYGALVALACRRNAVLRIGVRAGHFVLSNGKVVEVMASRPFEQGDIDTIRQAFVVGSERSPAQDIEYSARQLVEIALRALSPGINDPFTAIAVIDRLGVALEQVAGRSALPTHLRDKDGAVRVIANRSTFDGFINAALNQIRQASKSHPGLLIRIADTLGALAPSLKSPDARRAALSHLNRLRQTAAAAGFTPSDHHDVTVRIDSAEADIARDSRAT